MEAKQVARIFHDWVAKEGLLEDSRPASLTSTEAEISLLGQTDDRAKDILRRRGIHGVMFNESDAEVVVLTRKAKPTKKQLDLLPTDVSGVRVIYRQGSPTVIGVEKPRSYGAPTFRVRVANGDERYACGSSISQGNCAEAGTLGCLVRDPAGVLYGLSNNHVSGGCSHANVGLPILAPGVFDVAPLSHDPFTIGYHERALDMIIGIPDNVDPKKNLDAAIFKIADESRVTSHQGHAYDTPSSSIPIQAGMMVEKIGRTTGHTHGKVVGQWYGAFPVTYSIDAHQFKGRVFFDPVYVVDGATELFADHGDSGALVTSEDSTGNRRAVGVVVGGMKDGTAKGGAISLVLPIEPILKNLGVTLASGHNV